MASIMALRKKKLSLNTIVREFILVNRHKQNRFDHVFDYEWNESNYYRKTVVNLLMAETPDRRAVPGQSGHLGKQDDFDEMSLLRDARPVNLHRLCCNWAIRVKKSGASARP
jgi:hypothetical protein